MFDSKVTVIAEVGVNHNGDFKTAMKMIEVAKECGADIVKFQTAKLDSLVSEKAEMADYQKINLGEKKTQKEMLKELLLPFEDFKKLAEYCKEVGIKFLSTPFDIESIRFLNDIQDVWKIPSGEITNYPYLVEIAMTGKRVIMSTGMATLSEIRDAILVLTNNGTTDITLLHCTTDYPTPMKDVNLNSMLNIKNEFGYPVGYSDHTNGIEVAIAAVAMGATIIEKHFTLDRTMRGPDHKASLEPEEFRQLVKSIRNIEIAKGSYEKVLSIAEIGNRDIARKSIVAKKAISKGECFSNENITTKRPGNGVSPMLWNEIIGTAAIRDFEADELITI